MAKVKKTYPVYVGEKVILLNQKPDKTLFLEENFFPFFPKPEELELMAQKIGKPTGRFREFNQQYQLMIQSFRRVFQFQYAAGGLVWNSDNQLLFIFRKNKWDLPKGGIEAEETRRKAAMREVCEETGVDGLSIIRKLNSTYHTFWRNGYFVVKKSYWYEMLCEGNQKTTPQKEEGITEARWFGLEEIPFLFNNTYPGIRDLVSDALGLDTP